MLRSGFFFGLYETKSLFLVLLVRHDAEDELIGFLHAVFADAGQIVDAAIYVVVDDAFDRGDGFLFHGEDR